MFPRTIEEYEPKPIMKKETDEVDLGDNRWDRNRVETRKVQQRGRVDIPGEWLEDKGISTGDSVMVVECEDGFYITRSTLDGLLSSSKVRELITDGE